MEKINNQMHDHHCDCWRVGQLKANLRVTDPDSQTTADNLASSLLIFFFFWPEGTTLRFKIADRGKRRACNNVEIIMNGT